MSIAEKLILGFNTTVIGMGIVFIVLIALSFILMFQSKIVATFFKGSSSGEKPAEEVSVASISSIDKTGTISGETTVTGIDDEETVALIMAVVSHHVNVPLHEIRFKSIKAI